MKKQNNKTRKENKVFVLLIKKTKIYNRNININEKL